MATTDITTKTTPTVVHANVFDPSNSIFKQPKSARAECQTITCELPQCDLRDKGTCACRAGLFCCSRCPYGRFRTETGPTRRSTKFYSWLREQRDKHKDVPFLRAPPNKLAFVGDYVYLPYPHMDMCKEVSFLGHTSLFVQGTPFAPKDHWTIDTVMTLIGFRPEAVFGGEITSYQKQSVPLFIQHIRELDADMWRQLVERRPGLDSTPDYVGRKAYLRTLSYPISIPAKNLKYPVVWNWDGERLTTTSVDAYSTTWGGFPCDDLVLSMVPPEDATVVVASNDWVTSETKFVD